MDALWEIGMVLLVAMGISLVLALAGLALIYRRMRNLNVPPDADYFETMRYVPLSLVILLDLLDFGLDFLAAPLAWVILDRMGLTALRNPAALETLIPGTQLLPTFTLSWVLARAFNLGGRVHERHVGPAGPPRRLPPDARADRPRRSKRIIDMD